MAVRTAACAFAVGFLSAASNAIQAQSAQSRALQGLDSLTVVLQTISGDAVQMGLSEDRLRTKVELQLRRYGIVVLENQKGDGRPFFYLAVNVIASPVGFIYHIQVQLNEAVIAVRRMGSVIRNARAVGSKDGFSNLSSSATPASVWSGGMLGSSNGDRAADYVERQVLGLVDKFLSDFLAANTQRP